MVIVHFSDLEKLYADYLAATTIEGDNFVLDRQVVSESTSSIILDVEAFDQLLFPSHSQTCQI